MTARTSFGLAIAPVIATVIAASCLQPASAQSACGLTVYGRLNTGLEQVRASHGVGTTRLSNYRSVLGFRGEEDLGGGTKALWQLEGSLALDTGAGPSLTNRDTRLGLSGPWGTAFAGVWALPYTTATSAFDPFYPTTAGYMAIMGNGSASVSDHVQDPSAFDRRQTRQLQYWSPRVAGLDIRIAYAGNEGLTTPTGAKPRLASGSVSHETGGLLLVMAMERHDDYQARGTADVAAKLGAAYQRGPARVGVALERLRYETGSGALARNAWFISGTYRVGADTLKAAYARAGSGHGQARERVGRIQSGPDSGASQFTIGIDRELSRRTALQAFYGRIANDGQATYDFAVNRAGPGPGQHADVLSVGLRHSF